MKLSQPLKICLEFSILLRMVVPPNTDWAQEGLAGNKWQQGLNWATHPPNYIEICNLQVFIEIPMSMIDIGEFDSCPAMSIHFASPKPLFKSRETNASQGNVCMILWEKRPKKVRKTTTLRIGGRLKFGPSIRGAMWQPPTRSLSPDLVYVRSQGMGLGQLDNTFTKQWQQRNYGYHLAILRAWYFRSSDNFL